MQQARASNNASIGGMAVDDNGNVYITGSFRGVITFGTTVLNTLSGGGGGDDVFTLKFNTQGEVLWAHNTGGPSTSSIHGEIGRGIAVDKTGNVYVTGTFEKTGIFGSASFTASGETDVFVLKYTSSGDLQWAKSFGEANNDQANDIAVDTHGNTYITGFFMAPGNNHDVFITKYDSHGTLQWKQKVGLSGYDAASGIAVDGAGNVFITGYFNDMIAFGGITLTSTGSGDIFIAKYDTHGAFQWAKQAGGTQSDFGHDIAIAPSGHVYIIGDFQGTATFGNAILTSSGSTDVAIAKYTNNGDFQWVQKLGGSGADRGRSIAVDESGHMYITGSFQDSVLIGTTTLTSVGHSDIFIARYKQ